MTSFPQLSQTERSPKSKSLGSVEIKYIWHTAYQTYHYPLSFTEGYRQHLFFLQQDHSWTSIGTVNRQQVNKACWWLCLMKLKCVIVVFTVNVKEESRKAENSDTAEYKHHSSNEWHGIKILRHFTRWDCHGIGDRWHIACILCWDCVGKTGIFYKLRLVR